MLNWHPSLLRHLLAWSLGALLVVWAVFVAVGYRTGVHEADELTDGHLASVASLLLAQPATEFLPSHNAASLGGRSELKAHDYQQSLSVVVWNAQGRLVARSGEAPTPDYSSEEGFATLLLGKPSASWRVFSRWDGPAHGRKVMVLLSVAERDDLAEDIAEQVAGPGLWLLPVVALVLVVAMRRGLRPLHELSRQVHRLDIHQSTPLDAPPHEEFEAVVTSINTLVERYKTALERERALASEVAHELRTPLASLSLHAASLQRGLSAQEHQEALRRIELDASRAGAVLSDLLALARASRTELAEAKQKVDLAELARRVTAEFGQLAHKSGHELSLDAAGCTVNGHPALLELALRNLIDNALTHTPPGTVVQVRVSCGPATLEVRDNGRAVARTQGVSPSPGLGLGHQLVRRVALAHEGRFEAVRGADPDATCWRIVLGD